MQCKRDHIQRNLMISNEDRRLLARLAARDISISLICDEVDAYHVRVQALTRHIRYNATVKAWQVPIGVAGLAHRLSLP
jgi:hypothetical protein